MSLLHRFSKNVCVLGVLLLAVSVISEGETIEPALLQFLATLEKYELTQNDVVFLLDESGSITVERFPDVIVFTKMVTQRLAVSSDYSRVAVATFSTDTTTHIDYIKNPSGNNMCTLLKQIDDIPYAGGWTHTDKAMELAEDILASARPNSTKIIVLLTDGQSNDFHSPVSVSRRLKSKGVVIFAIGVADVNVQEINDVATSKNHTYILSNFDYIKNVSRLLVKDITESSLDLAPDPSYCGSTCDRNAKCYCGANTGRYECICDAGYSGKGGLTGQCHKCPKGTYKNESNSADCTACPEHSTTKNEGSTSPNDCKCHPGYEKVGTLCLPVQCASLHPPAGGILIPTHCNNTYGSQCSFRCFESYCPFSCNRYQSNLNSDHSSLPSRTCLETGKWSNEEFLCEKMTCPALLNPVNGKHNCSDKDFTHGSICQFTCDKGYELTGSKSRTCLLNSWTGQDLKCQEIYCDKLKTNALLHVKPSKCSTDSLPYRSVCVYSCAKGYALVLQGKKTNGILQCGTNKLWSAGYDKISCEDIEPPEIVCPKSVTADADPNKGLALVEWDKPNATDNVHVIEVRIIQPKQLKKPAVFPIGVTKVVYEAIDHSKMKSTCSFLVEVVDKEPPKVISCPSDIEIYHDTNKPIPVTWDGPIFEDNSKIVTFTSNRKSGDEFSWGPPSIVYFNASDPSGNTASCSFTVKVKHHPCPYYSPPANGVMTCDNWNDGRLCSIFCHEGFEFATGKDLHDVYYCTKSRKNGKLVWKWEPFLSKKDFTVPWPDCSRKQPPISLNVSVGVSYTVDSCSDSVIQNMQEKFFNLAKTLPSVVCPLKKGCAPENVKVTCNSILARRRRSTDSSVNFINQNTADNYGRKFNRIIRETQKLKLKISFDIVVFPNQTNDNDIKLTNEPGEGNNKNILSNSVIKELEDEISLQVKDIYNVTSVPKPEVNYEVIVMCAVGQIVVNSTCVNCPAGTYKDDVSETCIACTQASYQDKERQLSCKACPVGYTTYGAKSKSIDDCKGPCQPGTYSKTAFEPCFACPLNTYQNREMRKDCLKCPPGLYTWKVGANSSNDCVAPCKPGSFSDIGYEPCTLCDIGSFQDKEMQKNCTICPNQTSTTVKGRKSISDCKEIDVCNELNPCQHGSTCIQQDKDYECACPEGMMGKNCEINFDDCASSPCLNNGTCIDDTGNFTCICLDGWTGHQCEINQDDCTPNPCFNGGECIDKVNTYECQCIPGFTGERCEKNIYECESNPCLNNGTCFDKQNGYRCCCAKGYFGLNCELEFNIDICDTVTCQNGGTCFADQNDFNCTCPPGFEGEFCELNIDNCKANEYLCFNGGICVNEIENATCICPKKFYGLHCEKALMPEYLLSFPTPMTSNYAKVENIHRLPAITVAFFMRTNFKDPNSRATPVSYSYKYQGHLVDNALTLLDTNNFVLYIHGYQFHTEYTANRDAVWHHYAVTWEKLDGKWSFYVDGKLITNGNAGKDKYMYPGTFILGQEQDDTGSRFSILEAFAGDITEFNVWDYALSVEEIQKISSSCGHIGNIIPWYIVSQSVYGDVMMFSDVDKCKDLGSCPENSCDCFYSNEEYTCKHDIKECIDQSTCFNAQPCISNGNSSFCNCSEGFEGRHCEYDIDECLEKNGGCSYFCINDIGTGHHCECPENMLLSEDGKTCKDTSYCLKDRKTYIDGEVWMNLCQNCTCNQGIIDCEEIACNETECHEEETMIISPGECCPKCVAWSFCLISPNNTIISFDMSKYQIEGKCTYTAVEDCIAGHFKVQIESSQNETNLIIYQDCYKVLISSNGTIFIDDSVILLPFTNEEFIIEERDSFISVKTNSDLLVQWNFMDEVMLGIPITNVNKMCGVCSKVEEYYVYGTGKFPLSQRIASGENECFIISEGDEEKLHHISGSLSILQSEKVFSVLLITVFMCFLIEKLLLCNH